MKTNFCMKLLTLVVALAMVAGCASFALAWEPQWEHDEDLSAYKLCENPGDITITLAVTDHSSIASWKDNDFTRWVEEVTNANLEFVLLPYESRAEKLSLLLGSGNYPDAFLSCGMTDANVAKYAVEEGMFLPLEDLIAEYGTFTKGVFEEYPGSEGIMTETDGHIYSLPNVNECYHCTIEPKIWINQAWLDNLSLEMPTTLDEFYDVLVAFRDNDANGNGDPTDEIPFSGDYQDGWYTNPEYAIMNAYTYYNLDLDNGSVSAAEAFGMYVNDGTITTGFATDEWKSGVEFVANLVNEGLLYEGSFTQDLSGLTQICESGRLGACLGGYILFANTGDEIYRQYKPCLPLTGPDGYVNVVSLPYDSVSGHGYMISASCEHPEEAFKIGDLLLSYAASMRSYYGVYGTHWTDAEEGAVGINGEPAMYKILVPWNESQPQSHCILQMTISMRDAAFRLGEPSSADIDLYSSEGLETLLYQVTNTYEPFTDDSKAIPPLKFTAEQNAEMALIKATLATTIKEGMMAFFTGSKTVENDYDKFLSDIDAQGLTRLVEIYQEAYDVQYGK